MAAKWPKAILATTGIALATMLSFSAPGPVAQASPVAVGVTTTLDGSDWSLRAAPTSSRKCAAAVAGNATFSGSTMKLSVRKATGSTYKSIVARAEKLTGKKTAKKACPNGAFTNAAVGTGNSFTMTAGTVEANVKFPASQGMHGSVWLKSTTTNGEIDMVESYGHGYGLTSGVYTPSKNQNYVAVAASRSRSWWLKSHTYSVSWTAGGAYTFKIDGVQTFSFSSSALNGQKFELVASLLTSDWELGYLKHPVKRRGAKGVKKSGVPQTMVVNWVRVTPAA